MTPCTRIGLLTWEADSFFVARVLTGLRSSLLGSGFELEIIETKGRQGEEYQRFILSLSRRADLAGLLYTHLRLSPAQLLRFRSRLIPMAAVGEKQPGIDWAMVDEAKGGELATRHLLQLGHRRIALISGPDLAPEARLREQGYLRALLAQGLEPSSRNGLRLMHFNEGEGHLAMNMLLDSEEPPSAVFVSAGDLTALGALKALRDRGKRVPEAVSVVGFDNLEFCDRIYPKLTSINQPLEAMGAWAGKRLVAAAQNPSKHSPQGEIFEPELILRESTAAPIDLSSAVAA